MPIGTRSQVTKETSASGSPPRGASSAFATPSARSFCGLNGGMLAESSETVSERLPETRTKERDAHQFAIAHARADWHAQYLPRNARFGDGGQPIGLADSAQAVADAGDRSAQRGLDAFRRRSEIGFAVQRSKNGAAHEGGAAQSGQDCAAEPLQRKPAPVDETAGAAVCRKRRLVAEINGLGLEPPICAAQPSLVQDHRPLQSQSHSVRRTPRLSEFVTKSGTRTSSRLRTKT